EEKEMADSIRMGHEIEDHYAGYIAKYYTFDFSKTTPSDNTEWSVTTVAGVTLPTDDSTVMRIMAAKVLYDDGDSTEEKLTAGLQSAQDIFAPYYFELLNNPATLTLNNQLLIYPNPATNKVVVEIKNSNNAAELKLMITDVFGKILQTENINHENLKTTINTSAFTSGIYFFKLLSGNQQFDIKKLVVVK
ncbi:MAG: T9SS type A sorting domain-containing protein, partial [Chitinophagales bacterium]|nr:T9SS type A sorting domain-containing protein [Chitinophagales bacterium]